MAALSESLKVIEGEVEFVTWYKVVGAFGGPTSCRPLVALHDGPLFLDELENLLAHLGVQDNYDILGARHAAAQPKGLKHLILASTPADMGVWVRSQNALLTELPQDIQDTIHKQEEEGTTESPEYQQAMGCFYSRFLCRSAPLPEPIAEGFGWIQKDPTVYLTIPGLLSGNGPSEFHLTGPLKDWSMTNNAHKTSIRHYSVVELFFWKIPRVRWTTFAESSDMIHFEERERYMEISRKLPC
ncbi:proline iminopeptidase [Mycena olivaceomarginata]|nr:proline iminopeptidase [Mycena olivaceomarginata]